MEINGETRLTGIIGYPLTYTISPQIHNAAFDKVQLNIGYVPMVVRPNDLANAIVGLQALGFIGFNVTMPHKESAVKHLDRLDSEAQVVGAVNTISFAGGQRVGHNTDVKGFLAALAEVGFKPEAPSSVVIGAGGAARAVVAALASLGAEVAVANRNRTRSEALVNDIKERLPNSHLKVLEFDEGFADKIIDAELIVNATPVGMTPLQDETPVDADLLHSGQAVFDLVYEPAETRLIREATNKGARTIGGLRMLLHQAAASFEIWTGTPAPLAAMADAAILALRRGS
ncbi:MAG: shikimate dehydrogenase [Actinobacteria bacterium]|nr:shikimate dehydrogenase [Actinomycetota bacterium]